ncbi:MAG TPA: M6 family metalloprotease domain-containing protein [Anaeromyxobacter sp.]|nr:M6 family metalloprotease domain-containing protein [Anaeromyxobacter sp.]
MPSRRVAPRRLTALGIALLSAAAVAAPAPPSAFSVQQPDGSALAVRAFGDEHGLAFETLDGYAVAQAATGEWRLAWLAPDGQLVASDRAAHAAREGFARHLRPAPRVLREMDVRRRDANAARAPLPALRDRARALDLLAAPGPGGGELAGRALLAAVPPASFRLAVLLVEFPDVRHTYRPDAFRALFFSEGTYRKSPLGYDVPGSVREYWAEVSYGQLSLTGEVFDWVLAAAPRSEYLNDVGRLRDEAVARSGVDLSQFDGYALVYAGEVQSSALWPSARADWYVMSETFDSSGDRGVDLAAIGTHCHELGHVLGLPDLYFGEGNIGVWGLMGVGCYTDRGHTPPHIGAWEKRRLGWLRPQRLIDGFAGELRLAPVSGTAAAYEIVAERSTFVLENRQRIGFDAFLPGSGLLVWHVDETQASWTSGARWIVDLVEADGIPAWASSAGTPFPGADRRDAFTCATAPSSADYDGSCSFELTRIVEEGADLRMDAIVSWRTGVGITVNGAGDFPTLFTALALAPQGSTVRVPAGTFRELVRLPDAVSLVGAGPGRSILEAPDARPLVMPGEDSAVSGFTLRPAAGADALGGYALQQGFATAFTVTNSAFVGFYTALGLWEGWPPTWNRHTRAARVTNNVFDGNAFALTFTYYDGFDPTIRNNAFIRNDIAVQGGTAAPGRLGYNAYSRNRVDVSAVDATGDDALGPGDVRVDPLFVNPDAGDYRLAPGSPCIDAGDPDSAYRDADGSRADIGAFGGPGSTPPRVVVTRVGSGTGRVVSAPPGIDCGATCSATYASATDVTLVAETDPGSRFDGWSGACQGTGDCALTVSGDVAVTARFTSTACPVPDDCHESFVDASGACVPVPKPDGAACDDGDACTRRDACLGGACVGADLVRCESPEPCAASVCSPATGECLPRPVPDGSACEDKDPCTTGETCNASACGGGSPVQCEPAGECHTPAACETTAGGCTSSPLLDGTPCSIGRCIAGVCTSDPGRLSGPTTPGGDPAAPRARSGGGCATGRGDASGLAALVIALGAFARGRLRSIFTDR